jgi:hypothetical protein
MSKKILTAVAALMLTGSVAVTTSAQAKPFWGGYHHHHGYGWGAPLALGLGALAIGGAYAAASYDGCYVARRPVTDSWGNVYYRRVRVCD